MAEVDARVQLAVGEVADLQGPCPSGGVRQREPARQHARRVVEAEGGQQGGARASGGGVQVRLEVLHEADLTGRVHVVRAPLRGGAGDRPAVAFEGADRGDQHITLRDQGPQRGGVPGVGDGDLQPLVPLRRLLERVPVPARQHGPCTLGHEGVHDEGSGVARRTEHDDAGGVGAVEVQGRIRHGPTLGRARGDLTGSATPIRVDPISRSWTGGPGHGEPGPAPACRGRLEG